MERRLVALVRWSGLGLIVLGLTADLFGLGGQQGFGERQTLLVLAGALLLASSFVSSRRKAAVPAGSGASGFRAAYVTFAVLLLNTLLGFLLLNLLIAGGFALTDAAGWTTRPDLGMGAPLLRLPMGRLAHAATDRLRAHSLPALLLDDAELTQIYPGWPRRRVGEMLEESWRRPLRFNPDTEFQEKPFQGRYFNVREPGYRLIRDPGPWPPDPASHNVWVFGGSTTFGYGVPDGETIPSFLQESLRRRYPGAPVHVYNFGQGYFYSSQELALLRALLASGAPSPEVAVFIDGINEYQSEPFYGDYLRTLLRSPEAAFLISPQGSSLARAEDVVERWLRNRRVAEGICGGFQIKPLFVWQPAPDWQYDLRHHLFWDAKRDAKDPVLGSSPQYAAMARLRASSPERLGRNFLWLGDLQRNERRPLYVDRLHYTAAFNREIAERVADRIQQGL